MICVFYHRPCSRRQRCKILSNVDSGSCGLSLSFPEHLAPALLPKPYDEEADRDGGSFSRVRRIERAASRGSSRRSSAQRSWFPGTKNTCARTKTHFFACFARTSQAGLGWKHALLSVKSILPNHARRLRVKLMSNFGRMSIYFLSAIITHHEKLAISLFPFLYYVDHGHGSPGCLPSSQRAHDLLNPKSTGL